jgi:hypothetical protein
VGRKTPSNPASFRSEVPRASIIARDRSACLCDDDDVIAGAVHFAGTWHGASHEIWNGTVVALWVLFSVAVVLAPAPVLPGGRPQKIWWLFGLALPTWSFGGFFFPVGVLITSPLLLWRYRRSSWANHYG